jgi:hypothetical protein
VRRRGRRKRPTTTSRDHDSEGVGCAAAAGRREGETSAAGTKEEADVRRPAKDHDSKVGGQQAGETAPRQRKRPTTPRDHNSEGMGRAAAAGRREGETTSAADTKEEADVSRPARDHDPLQSGGQQASARARRVLRQERRPTPRGDHDSKVAQKQQAGARARRAPRQKKKPTPSKDHDSEVG